MIDVGHLGFKKSQEGIEEGLQKVRSCEPLGTLLLFCQLIFGLINQDIKLIRQCALNKPVNKRAFLSQVRVDEKDSDYLFHVKLAQGHLLTLCRCRWY